MSAVRNEPRILAFGFGNPGRLDDGLGPAFIDALEAAPPSGVTLDSDYQLNVEDANLVAVHDLVVFVDAAVSGPEPYSFRPVEPQTELSFSTHSVSPAGVLGLARDTFGRCPRAFVLGIRGYAFNEFGEALSAKAQLNLRAALDFFLELLRDENFRAPAARVPQVAAAMSGSPQ